MTTKEESKKSYLFNENDQSFQKKYDSKQPLIIPSFYTPKPLNFGSNFLEKKSMRSERLNGFGPLKNDLEFDIYGHAICPNLNGIFQYSYFNSPMVLPLKYSRFSNEEGNNNIKFEPQNLILNNLGNEQEDNYKIKNDEIQNNRLNIKNSNNSNKFLYNYLNGNNIFKQNNYTPEKNPNFNLNQNMNLETPINNNNQNNTKTKFFTNHNYGYKCSCSKTQCNRKYCECYNSGNYCIDCNCKNCNNKPPENSYTNKHLNDESSKNKKEKIICTCTKSGCNKNYCECFKNGQKCSELCRCISCENNDKIAHKKNININYECCPANSIKIIKNNLIIEKIKNGKICEEEIKNGFNICTAPSMEQNFLAICKKRKREETKNNEENFEKKKKICKNTEEIELFNDSLFDKNGQVILRHINLIHM
jgi:hypothetical protein